MRSPTTTHRWLHGICCCCLKGAQQGCIATIHAHLGYYVHFSTARCLVKSSKIHSLEVAMGKPFTKVDK